MGAKLLFWNLPFYNGGKSIGEADTEIAFSTLKQTQPDLVLLTGEFNDPHGTHEKCAEAFELSSKQYLAAGGKEFKRWNYRGAWEEWPLWEADFISVFDKQVMDEKIGLILDHISQHDPMFPGSSDPREFFERARDRNLNTARQLQDLGLLPPSRSFTPFTPKYFLLIDKSMNIIISPNKSELGQRAAQHAAQELREALEKAGEARLIVATGASQFEMLAELVKAPNIAWNQVTIFHLDEYVGMDESHPASFRRYLRERFIEKLPVAPAAFHAVNGDGDLEAECARLDALIATHPIDVACIGIGENGHLAFNDPPADFETDKPFLVVELDEACRAQQMGEGWFPTIDDVPAKAISMSIRQILKSKVLVVSVPDERKAHAVKSTVEGEISPMAPSSILRTHSDVTLYVDEASASLLGKTSKAPTNR